MCNQVEHSDSLCLLLIIYFFIRISFFYYLAKILLGQPRLLLILMVVLDMKMQYLEILQVYVTLLNISLIAIT